MESLYEVIIAEKEEAAKEIAEILWHTFETFEMSGIKFFKHESSVIVPARGHLLNPKIKGVTSAPWINEISNLPCFDIVWKPAKEDLPRLGVIKKLCDGAERIIVATDYDREGEVIGFHILQYIGTKKNLRMYYSSLSEREVLHAYENLVPMSEAMLAKGLARNYADPIIGLNLTKALTLLYKERFSHLSQAMSLGRVQSPLLEFLSRVTRVHQYEEATFKETHERGYLHYIEVDDVDYVITDLSNISGKIESLEVMDVSTETSEIPQAVELFDTNTAISAIGISPIAAMQGLESLYLRGFATYPRTKSTHIDDEIMAGLEEKIREHKDIPEEFSHDNTPEGKSEEMKQAIVLTETGIDALFSGKIRGHVKLIADVILNQMIRSMACHLLQERTLLDVQVDGIDEPMRVEWSRRILNLPLAIDTTIGEGYEEEPTEIEERPEIDVGSYNVTSLSRKLDKQKIEDPLYKRIVIAYGDLELVEWMTRNNIGTESTRVTFPSELQKRHYTIENNLPTVLGIEIGSLIKAIGLNLELTVEMEERIEDLENLAQLQGFNEWINELTEKFIMNLGANQATIHLTCDNGHDAELINTKNGLLMHCDDCNKFIRI